MPIVTLPDGKQIHYNETVSVKRVAESIGPGIAKAALAAVVNGKLVDLSYLIVHDAELKLITERDPEGLEVIRHSCAHLLAQAVKQLFPAAQVTIGPVIEEGFYYDFAFERPFTMEDVQAIEQRMAELVKQKIPVTRRLMSRAEASQFFTELGEHYKVDIINAIPADETLSVYTQGDFSDLCRGPHVPNTSNLKAFKLMKVAGAYWRGDSNNQMLQRIYGTAWATKEALQAYLVRIEEAEKRDHRKLGKVMDLFHHQEEAPGMAFWHPLGWQLYLTVEQYMRQIWLENGYQELHTPQLVDLSLWQRSGHWDKFGNEMFQVHADEEKVYALKPMSCPCHIQVFNNKLHSYRELPLRFAEFGHCHRNEPSGTIHGIFRTRSFVQDDGHIFCAEADLQAEVSQFIDLLTTVYRDFGFEDIIIKLSTRPEQRVGSDDIWDKSEGALEQALNSKGVVWEIFEGEGAFYGPKIEFSLRDCIGRVWQCGTMQVDFSMPERLGAQYVDSDGNRKTPVMLHRAIFGSLERFIGILIEHYAGALPLWLAPLQAVVLNITDNQSKYAARVAEILQNNGLRAKSDLRNEKIGFKIREHTLQKVPYLLVVGDREVESETVAVRILRGQEVGTYNVAELIDLLKSEVARRRSLSVLE